MDLKKTVTKQVYNFFWQTWPEGFKPTGTPDRYTIKISTSRRQRKGTTDKRLAKEAKEFQAANGYTGYKVVGCDENNMLQIYDYTVDFVR